VSSIVIERAGGATAADYQQQAAVKLRNAPPELRRAAGLPASANVATSSKPIGTVAATRRSPPPARRYCGWLGGVAVCGVSVPTHLHDGRMIPEQFHDDALRSLAKQATHSKPLPLTWGHGGPTIATSSGLDFILRQHPHLGVTFTARLEDNADNRRRLEAIGNQLVGVSVSFVCRRGWVVERDSGPVRIVAEAELRHVAIVPPGKGTAAYPAACAVAYRGEAWSIPERILRDAHLHAWALVKRQAGAA
jgi:hypothetical protein